jgi:hypothetical protein
MAGARPVKPGAPDARLQRVAFFRDWRKLARRGDAGLAPCPTRAEGYREVQPTPDVQPSG